MYFHRLQKRNTKGKEGGFKKGKVVICFVFFSTHCPHPFPHPTIYFISSGKCKKTCFHNFFIIHYVLSVDLWGRVGKCTVDYKLSSDAKFVDWSRHGCENVCVVNLWRQKLVQIMMNVCQFGNSGTSASENQRCCVRKISLINISTWVWV